MASAFNQYGPGISPTLCLPLGSPRRGNQAHNHSPVRFMIQPLAHHMLTNSLQKPRNHAEVTLASRDHFMLKGKMKNAVQLLGTDLKLAQGELVRVEHPSNLPKEVARNHWFVSARRSNWPKGVAILVDHTEVTLGVPRVLIGRGKVA